MFFIYFKRCYLTLLVYGLVGLQILIIIGLGNIINKVLVRKLLIILVNLQPSLLLFLKVINLILQYSYKNVLLI